MAKAKTTTTASKLYTRAQRMTRAWLASSGWSMARLATEVGTSATTIHRLKHKQPVTRTTTLALVITRIKQLQAIGNHKVIAPKATKAKTKAKTKIKKAKGFTSPRQLSLPSVGTDADALTVTLISVETAQALNTKAAARLRAHIEEMGKAPDLRAEVVALRTVNAELTKVNLELRNMADANGARVADLLNQVLDLRAGR